MSPAAAPAPPPLLLVPWEYHLDLLRRFEVLERKLSNIEAQQSEWVDTKTAKVITGIKSCAALKRKRELPNSLIIVRFEGKTPKYLRASLVAYCDSKIRKPVLPGRNLAASPIL